MTTQLCMDRARPRAVLVTIGRCAALLGVVLLAMACGPADAGDEDGEVIAESSDEALRSVAGARPSLGINLNGEPERADLEMVQRTQTRWVRAFIDVFLFQENPARYDEKIGALKQLKARGHKIIVNIKWNFHERTFPPPGSATMRQYQGYLTPLLDRVWPETDIIVSGNEPFIESRRTERDGRLVDFYREMTQFTHEYRARKAKKIPIFVGAFQNPHSLAFRGPAMTGLLAYVTSDPNVAGIDLHIHHDEGTQITESFRYVDGKIRPDQRILVTEFSLMHQWRSRLGETIPRTFARQYDLPLTMRNHEYIDRVLQAPVARAQWTDFLRQSPWFEARKNYLRNAHRQMSSFPKFYASAYGVRQSFPEGAAFTENTDPWIINALYANRTVEPNPDGSPAFNYAWIDDFRGIQRGAID